jgi:fructose 1,6-bisphosphatase
VHGADEVVHGAERLGWLVDDEVGALGDDVEVVVGHHRGDLDDDVHGRVEAGHLEVHPHEHGRRS